MTKLIVKRVLSITMSNQARGGRKSRLRIHKANGVCSTRHNQQYIRDFTEKEAKEVDQLVKRGTVADF